MVGDRVRERAAGAAHTARRRGIRRACVFAGSWGAAVGLSAASLQLDKPEYRVRPGEPFHVHVSIDMDESAPGNQVPVAGLFSAGSQVTFSPSGLSVDGPADVILPTELDGNGLGGPPDKVVEPGRAGAHGVVDFFAVTGYDRPTVLTVRLTAQGPGSFTLTPRLFYDPPRANFLDFEGTLLDPVITNFVSSVVHVGAEPRFVGIERVAKGTIRLLFDGGGGEEPTYIERLNPLARNPAWQVEAAAAIQTGGNGLTEAVVPARYDAAARFRVRVGAVPAAPRWLSIAREGFTDLAMVFEYFGLPARFSLERQAMAVCCPGEWTPVPGAVFTPIMTHRTKVVIPLDAEPGQRFRVRADPD